MELPAAPATFRFPRWAHGIRPACPNRSGFERSAGSSGTHHANCGPPQSRDALQDGGKQSSGNRRITPDYPEYYDRYPRCHRLNADINGDGNVDNFDISPFVALLVGD
jgi:hypothetical protein